MGWSLGAAFGAKKAYPDKLVATLIGEEAFQETAMDIETSVRNEAPVLIIINNNRKKVAETSHNDRRLDHHRTRRDHDPLLVAIAEAVQGTMEADAAPLGDQRHGSILGARLKRRGRQSLRCERAAREQHGARKSAGES